MDKQDHKASFLELRDISKTYGGVKALSNVSLTIEAGEVHCLAGENGSGKSTLIKIISGVQLPERGGQIFIDGVDCSGMTPVESIRRGIQVIYQDLSLFPNLTVAENVAIDCHHRSHVMNWKTLTQTARAAMQRIGVDIALNAVVGDLSIAQRQLVAIARAIANEARLVIMDEPTASLTRKEVDALLKLTLELKRKNVAVIFVSHRLDEVLEIADRVSVLRNSALCGTFSAKGMSDAHLAELMTGKRFSMKPLPAPEKTGKEILRVTNLSREREYEGVSFSVSEGEILGITGRLGSGRTELALSIFGMSKPSSGEIRIKGRPQTLQSNQQAIDAGIAYVPEDRLSLGLVLDQSIASNIAISSLATIKNRWGLVSNKARARLVRKWVTDLTIKVSNTDNAVATLSGGNQQRVVLAKWLAKHPSLLILDSPTVGVDIAAKDGIYAIVRDLASQGLAVIMISDEIPEVYYNTHRVLVMRDGRMAGEFIPHATTEQALREAVDERD